MEERQGYDVLRIVVHSDRCYMSTDYIKGKQLIVWLKYHSRIDKEMLFGWIRELIENLEHFHQCRGNPCYQYVNPYSIIVGENKKLYLLDLGSKEQDEMLHLMQRRYVRENFLSPENQYYQTASVQEDIYGFGKTVQYLLSAAEVEPSLGKVEELRLRSMISRCVNRNSKKCYQTIQEISEHFPNNRKQKEHKIPSVRKVLVCVVIFTSVMAAATQAAGRDTWNKDKEEGGNLSVDLSDTEDDYSQILEDYREEMQQKQEQWDIEKQEIEGEYAERERTLVYELALLYFIELEDYTKSREILESIGEPEIFAKDFIKLCSFLEDQTQTAVEEDTKQLLERLKGEIPDPGDERYARCISKGYEKIQEREEQDITTQDVEVHNTEVQNTDTQESEVREAEGQNTEIQEEAEPSEPVSGSVRE